MKSRTTSAVLTILFGPFGLFYTTVWGALALTVLAFVSAPTIVGPLFAWVVSIFWGDNLVRKHNGAIATVTPDPVQPTPAEPTPMAATEPKKAKGVSPVELVIYAALTLFLVFVLPDMLGRPEGMSALVFYMEMFGG